MRYLSRVLPHGMRILDLGCGDGRLALSLASTAREVVGVDISQSLLKRAAHAAQRRGLANVRFEQHALDESFRIEGFDVVLLSGVLNCLDTAGVSSVLACAAGALASGGFLYLRNNCANRESFFRPADAEHAPTYYRSGNDYVHAVSANGAFEVVEERFLFPPPLWPNLVYYHLLPRRLSGNPCVARMLDWWFALEERSSDVRLRLLGRLYGPLVITMRKPTSLRVLLAKRV
jgi:SAM-dependent methyltransferase